jgi:hypothetical protein
MAGQGKNFVTKESFGENKPALDYKLYHWYC